MTSIKCYLAREQVRLNRFDRWQTLGDKIVPDIYPSRRALITGLLTGCLARSTELFAEDTPAPQPPTNESTAMTPTEQLLHSTVQIICEIAPGKVSTGTGFFFALFPQGNQNVPVIVTNKHVVAGATVGHLKITLQKADGTPDLDNSIDLNVPNFPARWTPHPDPEVDLTIMPWAAILEELQKQEKKPFFITLDPSLIPTQAEFSDFTPLEDILGCGLNCTST